MKNFLHAIGFLISDLASTIVFLVVVLTTGNVMHAIIAGMVFGTAQIGWTLLRRQKVETMQWLSLGIILSSGLVSLVTGDARIVMMKPSLIYVIVGSVMLKRGWMLRYMPQIVKDLMPDVVIVFGYIWAALMFFSAAINIALALYFAPAAWAEATSLYALFSKIGLFLIQFATMRIVGRFRRKHHKPSKSIDGDR